MGRHKGSGTASMILINIYFMLPMDILIILRHAVLISWRLQASGQETDSTSTWRSTTVTLCTGECEERCHFCVTRRTCRQSLFLEWCAPHCWDQLFQEEQLWRGMEVLFFLFMLFYMVWYLFLIWSYPLVFLLVVLWVLLLFLYILYIKLFINVTLQHETTRQTISARTKSDSKWRDGRWISK